MPERNESDDWSIFDGPVEATDHHRTDSNKRLTERFVREVLIERSAEALPGFLEGEAFTQHSHRWNDGAEELRRLLSTVEGEHATVHRRLHRVLGEGDFVLTMSEGTLGGVHSALFDLFRISADKVVEHWEVIEAIPPREQWKNDNGKF
ncbi:hypothetical protein ABT275_39310 [Streptomyces sp. NPDC001185]|uniref:nuclear transport factor 2 family protein n=1 Tax=Streptomyces sp. NPDC001185 TaxID=3154380 RepID=UPI003325B4EB